MFYSVTYVLNNKFPDRKWKIQDEDYNTLTSLDDLPIPTMDDLISADKELQPLDYKRQRIYPPLGDQFDALWHDIDSGVLDKSGTFYKLIQQVKQKWPKPPNV